jgi:formate hydrogenlyase transcriptional activator
MNKQIDHIPDETMFELCSYDWPGNIRELQNSIERAVILSIDGVLPNPLPTLQAKHVTHSPLPNALKEAERSTILRVLEDHRWVVGGAEGAAAKLGLKRTTLIAKMERFGIRRPVSSDAGLCSVAAG